jgi:hypothetical protein
MAYDAPDAATDDLRGKAEQAAPDLPLPASPPSLEQVESANPTAAPADPGTIPGTEADDVQLSGPKLKDEEGTGLTGGPIGN